MAAHAELNQTIPKVIDVLLTETKSMHFKDFGSDEMPEKIISKAGLKEVYREDRSYVVYQEALNEEFILYYFPVSHKFLFAYDKSNSPSLKNILEKVSVADAAYTQNMEVPSLLIMQDTFPPKTFPIGEPELAEDKLGFSLDVRYNPSRPINKFLVDLAFDLMLYQGQLDNSNIVSQYLFTKQEDGSYSRQFNDGTTAHLAFNEKAFGLTAPKLNLRDFENYLAKYASNSMIAPFFPMGANKYQVINIKTEKRFTLSVIEDVRGEATDLKLPMNALGGLRIFANN